MSLSACVGSRMLPIRDRNPASTTPYVTYALIAINVLVFLLELSLDMAGSLDAFIYDWGMTPRDILAGRNLITLLTSMFLHGSITHIFGNMLYLYIFGNNIEDAMGHGRYLIFYLFSGLCASFLQIYLTTRPEIPNLGASGAIAGVLGAYLILYPRAKVDTVVFVIFIITWVTLPAAALLAFWFVLQLFSGFLSIVTITGTGVAYFAHVGGFIAGALIALPLRGRVRTPPEAPRIRRFYGDEDYYWR